MCLAIVEAAFGATNLVMGRPAEAKENLDVAFSLLEEEADRGDVILDETRGVLGMVYFTHGVSKMLASRHDEALIAFQKSRELWSVLATRFGSNLEYRHFVACT